MAKEEIIAEIRKEAEAQGVDPDLAVALAEQESGFNPSAVSKRGAQGVMQVMPETAAELQAQGFKTNTQQGVAYLGQRMKEYEGLGDEARNFALGGYNAGPGAVSRARAKAKAAGKNDALWADVSSFLPDETQQYVPGVLKRIKTGNVAVSFDPQQVDITPDDLLAEADEVSPDDLLAEADVPEEPRSLGESFMARTVGRLPGALDRALGGLPSAAAGAAGAASAGDEQGVTQALNEGGGTEKRLLNVLLGLLEGGLTARFPGAAGIGAGVGAGTEAVTGSKTAGDVAEIASGIAAPVAGIAKSVARRGGPAADVAADLASSTTAREAGTLLQAPKQGARKAISRTAQESSRLYDEAAATGKAAGAALPAGSTTLKDAIKAVKRDLGGLAEQMPPAVKRVVKQIERAGRGTKSKLVNAQGQPASTASRSVGVEELIEQQSNLRRAIGKLPRDHVARRSLRQLDEALEAAIDTASRGKAPVVSKLGEARKYYRETTIPTRKSAQRVANAETPEQAARMATQPSRFERITGAAPETAEPTRSAFFNDLMTEATKEGSFDIGKLSSRLNSAKIAHRVDTMANTPARKQAVKAIHMLAKGQNAAAKLPFVGPLTKLALTNDRAARVLYRLAKARAGTPAYKLALKAAKSMVGSRATGAAARVAGDAQEDE